VYPLSQVHSRKQKGDGGDRMVPAAAGYPVGERARPRRAPFSFAIYALSYVVKKAGLDNVG
jgi:hypothetical protein